LWVGATTPPTLLIAAENDTSVDVEHSIHFYDALRKQGVPAKLVLFPQGEHGFFQLTQDEWRAPLWAWLASNRCCNLKYDLASGKPMPQATPAKWSATTFGWSGSRRSDALHVQIAQVRHRASMTDANASSLIFG